MERSLRARGSAACAGADPRGSARRALPMIVARLDVAARRLDAHVVRDRRDRAVALEARRPRASDARTPCRTTRAPRPTAKRSSYALANQKRDESGVWISSMTTMRPSFVLPNSYLVSTRMRPRSAHTSCPRRKSAIAHLGGRVEVARADLAHREDLLARRGDVVIALLGLGARREDRLRRASRSSSARRAGGGRRTRARRARSASRCSST